MLHRSSTLPLCRYCAKPIPRHTMTHFFQCSQSSGSREGWIQYRTEAPENRAAVERLFNDRVIQIRKRPDGSIYRASTWDGESYIDAYFCKDECARFLGRLFARDRGAATQDYADAMAARSANG
jgi:hypothetical protein